MHSHLEPDVFVQSTVNRASKLTYLKILSKEEKNKSTKNNCKRYCRYKRHWFYTLGSARKNLNDEQKLNILDLI